MHNEELIRALQAERSGSLPARRVRREATGSIDSGTPRLEPSLDSEGLLKMPASGSVRRRDLPSPQLEGRSASAIGFVAKAQSGRLGATAPALTPKPALRKSTSSVRRGPAFTKPKKGWFSKFMDATFGMFLGINLMVNLALGTIFFYFVYRGLS